MQGTRRIVTARLVLAAVLAAAGAACDRAATTPRPALPTADTLAATPNAVGIPYGRYLLIRRDERLIALHLTALTPLGDRVAYRWHLADGDGRAKLAQLKEWILEAVRDFSTHFRRVVSTIVTCAAAMP